MYLLIKADNDEIGNRYRLHTHFNPGDSGLDLFIPEGINIKANSVSNVIDLGIACAAYMDENCEKPTSYYLYPRSSMGSKTPLRLSNSVGIIDSGYRGNIKAVFDNTQGFGFMEFTLERGNRYVQICPPNLEYPMKVFIVDNLDDLGKATLRGGGGFGSTGQ